MKKAILVLALLVAASGADATVVFQNLGTSAPPTSLGPYLAVPAFNQTPQTAISNGTSVSSIPGNPEGSDLSVSPNLTKETIGSGWATWSNGYTGAVYTTSGTSITLTLPTATAAFYFYAEPEEFNDFNVQATTAQGATSGQISVNGNGGANGFAFYSSPGDPILTITVTCTDTAGFAIGEFGAASVQQTGPEPVPALSPAALGILGAALALGGAFLLKKRAS